MAIAEGNSAEIDRTTAKLVDLVEKAPLEWTLAMLRESGLAALDRGDRAAAEAAWRQMLRQVLAPPSPLKARKPNTPAPEAMEREEAGRS